MVNQHRVRISRRESRPAPPDVSVYATSLHCRRPNSVLQDVAVSLTSRQRQEKTK